MQVSDERVGAFLEGNATFHGRAGFEVKQRSKNPMHGTGVSQKRTEE
jgi:predicted N-acetyltransferase YhbS